VAASHHGNTRIAIRLPVLLRHARPRARPLHIEVACTRPDGQQYLLALDNAMARLAAHEIEHLNGRLYTSRMREGTRPIPVSEYRGTGRAWTYSVQGRTAP
jgi:hypothetical protein